MSTQWAFVPLIQNAIQIASSGVLNFFDETKLVCQGDTYSIIMGFWIGHSVSGTTVQNWPHETFTYPLVVAEGSPGSSLCQFPAGSLLHLSHFKQLLQLCPTVPSVQVAPFYPYLTFYLINIHIPL